MLRNHVNIHFRIFKYADDVFASSYSRKFNRFSMEKALKLRQSGMVQIEFCILLLAFQTSSYLIELIFLSSDNKISIMVLPAINVMGEAYHVVDDNEKSKVCVAFLSQLKSKWKYEAWKIEGVGVKEDEWNNNSLRHLWCLLTSYKTTAYQTKGKVKHKHEGTLKRASNDKLHALS